MNAWHRNVVALADRAQQVTHGAGQRLRIRRIRFGYGCTWGRARHSILGQFLGPLNVRLVEGMDAHGSARHGDGDLCPVHLARQVVRVVGRDPYDRMPGCSQEPQGFLCDRVRRALRQVDEQSIRSIGLGGTEWLMDDGDDPGSGLSGAFGEQLFDPIGVGVQTG